MHATWFSSIQFHLNERCVNKKNACRLPFCMFFVFFFFQFFDASTNDRRRRDGDKNEFGFAYGKNKLIIVVESDANILTDAWCLRLPPCTAWAFVCRRTQYAILHAWSVFASAFAHDVRFECTRRCAMDSWIDRNVCRSRAQNSAKRRRAIGTEQQRQASPHRRLPLIKCSSARSGSGWHMRKKNYREKKIIRRSSE